MAWTTPITDRTQSDVDYAFANQNSISDLKGAFNISDANRIIDNSVYLKELIETYGFTIPRYTIQSTLTEASIPYISSIIGTMKNNVIALVNSFYSMGNPTIDFIDNLNYIMVNNMEINLDITNQLLVGMIGSFKICGTFNSGQSIIL